jgi:hypothetical protein
MYIILNVSVSITGLIPQKFTNAVNAGLKFADPKIVHHEEGICVTRRTLQLSLLMEMLARGELYPQATLG